MNSDLWERVVPTEHRGNRRTASEIQPNRGEDPIDYIERIYGGYRVGKSYPDSVINAGAWAVYALDRLEETGFDSLGAAWRHLLDAFSVPEAIAWLTAGTPDWDLPHATVEAEAIENARNASKRTAYISGDWVPQNDTVQMLQGNDGDYAVAIKHDLGAEWEVHNSAGAKVAGGAETNMVSAMSMAEYVLARRVSGHATGAPWATEADPWLVQGSQHTALAPFPTATVTRGDKTITVYATPTNSGKPKPWIAVSVNGDVGHEWFGGADRDMVTKRAIGGNYWVIDTSQYEWTPTSARKVLYSRRMAMAAPADLGVNVGDIFVNSWGYDQTNVDFYEVIRLTGQGVEVQPIGARVVSAGSGGQRVVPVPGLVRDFDVIIGVGRDNPQKSKVCRLKDGYRGTPSIVLKSGQYWASKWDGQPEYETDPYSGH